MDVEQQIYQLKQQVARLERQVAFLLQALQLEYTDQPPPIDPRVLDLVSRGKKMDAIRLYREQTGASLKIAKEFIESLE